MNHRELCELGAKWLTNCQNYKFKCPHVLVEFVSACRENPDIFGLRGSHSICIEVKVSRSDFKADSKKPHRIHSKGIGMTRYYLVPENLVQAEEVTNDWGLIYCDGKKFTVIKESKVFDERDFYSELNLMQSVVRRQSGNKKILDFRTKSP